MKSVLNLVGHGIIGHCRGQPWLTSSLRLVSASETVREQVIDGCVTPVRVAIGDRILNPILATVRAEFGRDRSRPSASQSKLELLQRRQAQGLKQELELVDGSRDTRAICQPYLTTTEAARYLRRSTSWLLRAELPFVPGRPNLYSIRDLDNWFELHKWVPKD